MAASIAEAEKEISNNKGEEVSMQKEIKQLEDQSQMTGQEMPKLGQESAKMAEDMVSDALQ